LLLLIFGGIFSSIAQAFSFHLLASIVELIREETPYNVPIAGE
jgi:hypothetical protein